MNEQQNDFWADAEIVHAYTRRQAIEDGVLIDLMQGEFGRICREAGFKWPIAMTTTAFAQCVGGLDHDELPPGQDQMGRLWDVLMVLRHVIDANCDVGDRVHFEVSVFNGHTHDMVKLWSHCGPGDAGEPVITIMLEGED